MTRKTKTRGPELEAAFNTAQATLLAPYSLDDTALEQVFGQILSHKVDYADLYFQYSRSEGWSLEEGIVKSGSFNIDQGVGVRAVAGEKTAFAYSDDISLTALTAAAQATRAIARQGAETRTQVARRSDGRQLYLPHDPLASLADEAKVALLEKIERYARSLDPRVTQVMAHLGGEYEVVLVSAQRRRDRRRRAAARAHFGAGDRRAGRPPRAGQRRRRRALRLRILHRCHRRGLRAQGGRAGADESRRAARSGRVHDGRARTGLAGHPAARSDRARAGGRFQSQGQLRIQRAHRRARRSAGRDGGRRRHHRATPRLAQHRRRRQPDAAQRADRGRRVERLHAGQPERAPDGSCRDRQRAARIVRAHPDAAHDEHLYAQRRQGPAGDHRSRSSTGSTR